MDEETSDDELPSISLSQDSSPREVVMPSAREVADQRALELRTERELQRLRELHSPPPPPVVPGPPPPPRSDSSGSEGEAALAASMRALRMPPAPPAPRAAHAPVARRLLALLPAPPHTLHQYATAFIEDASTTALRKLINRMALAISCALSCEYNAFTEDELVTCAGVLAAACLAAPRPLPASRRALHRALQRAQPHRAVAARLAQLAADAAGDDADGGAVSAARALLVLSDAARGGGSLADLLAALLVRRALSLLLALQQDSSSSPLSARETHELLQCPAGGWRRLGAPARLTALRLVARALRASGTATPPAAAGASETADRARVLAALAHPHQADKQHPDYLKVAAAASTLQLLFRAPPTHA